MQLQERLFSSASSLANEIPGSRSLEATKQREEQHTSSLWYALQLHIHVFQVMYLSLLALFIALALWVHLHPVLSVDVAITHEFQEGHARWLRALMVAISYPGDIIWFFVSLILLTVGLFWLWRLRLEACIIASINLTTILLDLLIKLLVHRPRPTQPLVHVLRRAKGLSFPSGHVTAYIAYWGSLFSFGLLRFQRRRWWRTIVLTISGLFVTLIGPSRIYLGDHWASDVLGAYVFGGLWLWLWLWFYRRLDELGVLAQQTRPVLVAF